MKGDIEYLHGGVRAQLFSMLWKSTLGLLDTATNCFDKMAILLLGWFVKTGLGDKIGPSKLSAGVSFNRCADAMTIYARDDTGFELCQACLLT